LRRRYTKYARVAISSCVGSGASSREIAVTPRSSAAAAFFTRVLVRRRAAAGAAEPAAVFVVRRRRTAGVVVSDAAVFFCSDRVVLFCVFFAMSSPDALEAVESPVRRTFRRPPRRNLAPGTFPL